MEKVYKSVILTKLDLSKALSSYNSARHKSPSFSVRLIECLEQLFTPAVMSALDLRSHTTAFELSQTLPRQNNQAVS